jgi:hypothetical protein
MTDDYVAQLYRIVVGPCPECGDGRVKAVYDGKLTNVLCPTCGACWHGEVDGISRVDPAVCPGCDSRSVCVVARSHDRPASTASLTPALLEDQASTTRTVQKSDARVGSVA